MSVVEAQPAAVFGCRPGVSGGICFLEEQLVLYAAGAACAQFHTEQRWHKFIPGGSPPPDPAAAAARPRPDPSPPRRPREEPGRAGAGRQPQPAVPGRLRDGGGGAGPDGVRADGGAAAAAEDAERRRAAGARDGGLGLLPRRPVSGGSHRPSRGAARPVAVGEAAAAGRGAPRGRGHRCLPGNGRWGQRSGRKEQLLN